MFFYYDAHKCLTDKSYFDDDKYVYGCMAFDKLSEEQIEMILKEKYHNVILSYGLAYNDYKDNIKDIKYYSVTEEFSNKIKKKYEMMLYILNKYNIEK